MLVFVIIGFYNIRNTIFIRKLSKINYIILDITKRSLLYTIA
jgi:hypothetical protein